MGVVAGARRTQSSFPRVPEEHQPVGSRVRRDLGSRSPRREDCAPSAHQDGGEERPHWSLPVRSGPTGPRPMRRSSGISIGSVDGLGFDQDRLTPTEGRLADPSRADEVVLSGWYRISKPARGRCRRSRRLHRPANRLARLRHRTGAADQTSRRHGGRAREVQQRNRAGRRRCQRSARPDLHPRVHPADSSNAARSGC